MITPYLEDALTHTNNCNVHLYMYTFAAPCSLSRARAWASDREPLLQKDMRGSGRPRGGGRGPGRGRRQAERQRETACDSYIVSSFGLGLKSPIGRSIRVAASFGRTGVNEERHTLLEPSPSHHSETMLNLTLTRCN